MPTSSQDATFMSAFRTWLGRSSSSSKDAAFLSALKTWLALSGSGTGPQGPAGPPGPAGPIGPQGPPPNWPPVVNLGTVTAPQWAINIGTAASPIMIVPVLNAGQTEVNWIVSRSPPVIGANIIPADRLATVNWKNAGLQSKGGPSGAGINAVSGSWTQSGSTITVSGDTTGVTDQAAIQNAINACPANHFVQLGPGTFYLTSNGAAGNLALTQSNMLLRGSGAGVTILQKAATKAGNRIASYPRTSTPITGATGIFAADTRAQDGFAFDSYPMIMVGPSVFAQPDPDGTGSSNLTVDAVQGSYSITVADGTMFTVGKFVLLDEHSNATFVATPPGFVNSAPNTQWQGDRLTWPRHNPPLSPGDDNFPDLFSQGLMRADSSTPSSNTDGRPWSEMKEIASISGNVVTFTSPVMSSYRVSHAAQLTRFSASSSVHIVNVGVESLTCYLASSRAIQFSCCAYSWIKKVEVDSCMGLGLSLWACFRCEIRGCHVHTSSWPVPSADSYAISRMLGTAETLIENNITRDYDKVIAGRAGGSGDVVAYNYFDDGWIGPDDTYANIVETGCNTSHTVGPHHTLHEGNYCFNFDSDTTHGTSQYQLQFRNWFSGQRKSLTDSSHQRCAGAYGIAWWFTFVGNVLGRSGQMSGWTYVDPMMGCDASGGNCVGGVNGTWKDLDIFEIGWGAYSYDLTVHPDSFTLSSLIRDGNWDWVTSSQKWHNTPATFTIPDSLYLPAKPAFFGTGPWPWVNPSTGATGPFSSSALLPAMARYLNGTPNTVPNE